MNEILKQACLAEACTKQSAPYAEMGAFLESLRLNRKFEGRRLSIRRLAYLAEMSNSTYEDIKRAFVRT